MKTQKTSWFSVFRRVVPADYELWLEGLARQGWHPRKIDQWSSIRLLLEKGQPKQYRYIFDLNALPKKDYQETYRQFGWEFMGQMASCFIWRRAYTGHRPESFSDAESLVARNRRVRNAVLACLALFTVALLALLVGFAVQLPQLTVSLLLQYILGAALCLFCGGYLAWVARQISRNRYR